MNISGDGDVPDAAQIVDGKLFAIGDAFALDGRVSWAPPTATGFQATRSYLLKEGDEFLVVDPGLQYQENTLVAQMRQFVPAGGDISVFLTRSEPDSFGCLGALMSAFNPAQVITGGGQNPFDGFSDIGSSQGEVVRIVRQGKIKPIVLGTGRELHILRAPLRINTTYWLYDTGTRALFTSDGFAHVTGRTKDEALALDRTGETPVEVVRDHLIARFWWMEKAYLVPLFAELDEVFRDYEIEIICPGRGSPIVGRAAVRKAYESMRQALSIGNVEHPVEMEVS